MQPAEMVFLDDVAQSVDAAREIGIHAVLSRETGRAIAELQACLDAGRQPGETVMIH